MDYEIFFTEFSGRAARVGERINAHKRLAARMGKAAEKGDLRAMARDLGALEEAGRELAAAIEELRACFGGFDGEAYIASGAFTEQFIAHCAAAGVDIRPSETEGVYEVFPYRVKIDPADVLIDRKKAATYRPKALTDTLSAGKAKLLAASFNPAQFLSELAAAYDLCALAAAKGGAHRPDADLYLRSIYNYLTPMRRFRREYDMQAFAFDLARLYDAQETDAALAPDGRAYQFGPSRNNSRAIRILDGAGRERFLATIRFYHKEG